MGDLNSLMIDIFEQFHVRQLFVRLNKQVVKVGIAFFGADDEFSRRDRHDEAKRFEHIVREVQQHIEFGLTEGLHLSFHRFAVPVQVFVAEVVGR